MRGRAVVARRAHNPEVSGSNPLPATVFETTSNGRFILNLYKSSSNQEKLRLSTNDKKNPRYTEKRSKQPLITS